ncbi:MAG: hypothetical protein ACRC4M_02835 [Mycoplasma sp.]
MRDFIVNTNVAIDPKIIIEKIPQIVLSESTLSFSHFIDNIKIPEKMLSATEIQLNTRIKIKDFLNISNTSFKLFFTHSLSSGWNLGKTSAKMIIKQVIVNMSETNPIANRVNNFVLSFFKINP